MRSLRRYFWRLPLHLRVLGIVGIVGGLLPVVSLLWIVPMVITSWSSPAELPSPLYRVMALALNLSMLGLACILVVNIFCLRFRHPDDQKIFPLSSWQSQLRAMTLLGALPLCGLVLALILPPVLAVYCLEFGLTGVAAVITTVTYLLAKREVAAMT